MNTFLKVLDPEETTTGGGSAAAIAGAMAGALIAMAASLSEPRQEDTGKTACERIFFQAKQISEHLLKGSQEDSEAFLAVRKAYRLPRETEDEKAARQQAIQTAWLYATQVPLENAKKCMLVYELGKELEGRLNPKLLSDFHCGLLLARAGMLGCLENVKINLPEVKDADAAAQIAEEAEALGKSIAKL